MTDQIEQLLKTAKARSGPELQQELESITRQVQDLQAENEQLREEKESLQTELEKTTKGTLQLASELEQRYQQLFESAVEGIYTTTEGLDEYRMANPAFADLLGYESGDAVCEAIDSIEEEVFVDPDRYAEYSETLQAVGEVNQFEYQIRTADGETRWVSDSVRAITDEEGGITGYRGGVIDITEEKKQEEALKRQTNLSIVLNRVLRHNLRNDISVVRGYTQMMADELDDTTHGEKALNTIDSLVELSEKARVLDDIISSDANPEPTDIPDLINGIVTQVRRDYPSASISVEADGGITAEVRPSFKRAIRELIENAAKHSGDEPTVEVSVESKSDDVHIRIADNGPGIEEQEARVLRSGSEKPLKHGSGLGLWLAHWIVTNHDGLTDAILTDEGTMLTVVIPRTTKEVGQQEVPELARSRDQYKAAFKEAGDGMTITDDKARILDVNKEAARIYGVDQQELIGRPIREFISDNFDFEAEWGAIKDTEIKRGEMKIVSGDGGGVSPIEYTAKSHIIPGQHLIVSRDVTERKEREQELERMRDLFEEAQRLGDLGAWEVEEDGNLRWTAGTRRIHEVEADFEPTVTDAIEFYHKNDRQRIEEAVNKAREAGKTYDVEARIITATGDVRWVRASGGPTDSGETIRGYIQDITEQKEREQELKRTNKLFERAQAVGEVGWWQKDIPSDDITWSEQVYEMWGAEGDVSSIDHETFLDFVHPEDAAYVDEQWEAAKNGQPYDIEHRIITGDGDVKWMREQAELTFNDDGEPVSAIGIVQDITELKEREQEIQQLKERLELAVEGAGLGVWDWDMTTGEVELNERYVEMLGYSKEEFGHHIDDWKTRIHPDDRERVENSLDAHIAGETEYFETEYRLQTVEGDWKWHQTLGRIVDRDGEGAPVRSVGVQIDISERKARERELQELKDRFHTLFERAPEAIALHDSQGSIQEVNEQLVKNLGYSREELLSMNITDFDVTLSKDKLGELVEDMDLGDMRQFESEHEREDGSTFPVDVWANKIEINGDVWFLGFARDITKRKDRERLEFLESLATQLTELASDLLETGQKPIEEKIDGALETIGTLVDADRSYVFQIDHGEKTLSNTHEWTAESVEPQIDNLQDLPIDTFPWWMEQLEAREPLIIPAVSELPPEASAVQEILQEQDFKSLIVSPMMSGDKLVGFIGFDWVEKQEPWSEDFIHILRISGEIISSAIQRESRRRELERREAYLDQSSDIISVMDINGEVKYQSASTERVTDFSPAEIIGDSGFEHIHPDDLETIEKEFPSFVSQPEEEVQAELRVETKDGSWKWIEVRGVNKLNDPVIDGLLFSSRDITKRKEREQEIQDLNERLELAIEGANIGIWDWDMEIDEVERDELLTEMLGYTPEEMGAHINDWERLVHPEGKTRHDKALAEHIENQTPHYQCEYRLKTASGDWKWVRTIGKVVDRDEDGNPVRAVGIHLDINDRKERERELQREKDRLDEFASVVSHDLRNPLNVAQGRVDLAREDSDTDHLDAAAEGIERSLELIDDLLTLARGGKEIGEMEPVEMADLVQTCWNYVETGDARVVTDLESTIQADRSRLRQLLENLFRNAVDHGGEDVTIRVGSLPEGFYVEDDGTGIPQEKRESVFEPSYSESGGSRFGLSIVKQIVDAHGWDIHITEGSEGGARFEITGIEVVAE
ncbi:PAS domain S-box protein [Halodesulfurarchaeum sp. HSR-GB]|uniref:PAS domain S-box protein n=1 Tax=Halodesulfurarchaeum sp. HSR-GB TaxID=3074077 RepID=UPI00286722DC|nr:PAS domain S-box protein [Halodesulfurarchaeum sp. HSR-GB]MDR5657846.1 PAS domain S-box protein [Halodesulfurarchaeum sp. HSR-GB]